MPTVDVTVQFTVNQRQSKREILDSGNPCVCLYRSLKLLTDDQVISQRFNSKHTALLYIVLFNLKFTVRYCRILSKLLYIALNQKVSITVTITQKCAIDYIQLTQKNTRSLDEMKKH